MVETEKTEHAEEEASHGADAENGEVEAWHWLPNDGNAGPQLDERNFKKKCGPKIQDVAHKSLDEVGMVAMSDYCDVFHHYNRE